VYAELTGRNIGFVTETEQHSLRRAAVFVCGIGGMGGACLNSLARAGVMRFAVADPDTFERSNMNRQLFAFLSNVGRRKVDATSALLRDINPEIAIESHGGDCSEHLDKILVGYSIVVNGMDDIAAAIVLYRKARKHGATVVDAYPSPLPSVAVVRPGDPRPEERLAYPTVNRARENFTSELIRDCLRREIEYVMTHSSSAAHLDLDIAAEVLAGTRPRMSFAPPVIITGNLMALEVINLILGRRSGTDHRGYFFNPWTTRVERPRLAPIAWVRAFAVHRALGRLTAADRTRHV
jgi:molybdopterin-synthase adenylyltransferase